MTNRKAWRTIDLVANKYKLSDYNPTVRKVAKLVEELMKSHPETKKGKFYISKEPQNRGEKTFVKPKGNHREIIFLKDKELRKKFRTLLEPLQGVLDTNTQVGFLKEARTTDMFNNWIEDGLYISIDLSTAFHNISKTQVHRFWKHVWKMSERKARWLTDTMTYRGHLYQGHPLSPLVFVFFKQAIDEKITHKIRKHGKLTYRSYADDTWYKFLPEELDTLRELLKLEREEKGYIDPTINLQKWKHEIIANKADRTVSYILSSLKQFGFKPNNKKTVVRYLASGGKTEYRLHGLGLTAYGDGEIKTFHEQRRKAKVKGIIKLGKWAKRKLSSGKELEKFSLITPKKGCRKIMYKGHSMEEVAKGNLAYLDYPKRKGESKNMANNLKKGLIFEKPTHLQNTEKVARLSFLEKWASMNSLAKTEEGAKIISILAQD